MKMDREEDTRAFFDFLNYRELLKYLYQTNKSHDSRFSYRVFAEAAGFGSASFLKRVIDGESDLSEESVGKIAIGFGLNQDKTHFLKNLVFLNQATTTEDKKKYAEEILKSKNYRKFHPLSEAQYLYYSQWYYVPVRELVGVSGFREDYEWIANAIIPQITPLQARKAVENLLALDLLRRNKEGELEQSERVVTTPDEVVSSALGFWHKEMMKKAAESIDLIPRELRDISAVTLRLSRKNVKKAKELVQKFRRELVSEMMADSADSIYELNIQLFPLSIFIRGGTNDQG